MPADPGGFGLDTTQHGDHVHLQPRGELDLATAPSLEGPLLEALHEGTHVVLDLRSLEFMDSTGVRVLVAGHQAAAGGAGRLTIIHPGEGNPVARVLDVSGVGSTLGMVDGADVD